MLLNLPNSEQFAELLTYYEDLKSTVIVQSDSVQDPMFFVGVLSILYEVSMLIETLPENMDIEDFKTSFAENASMRCIFAAGKINEMIGKEAYNSIIAAYNHPMFLDKDINC